MFGFSKPDHRSAIIVDVGSSSVGVAIVCTHPDDAMEIIWDHREYCLIRDDSTATHQIKQIKTALANAFLELNHSGLAALKVSGHSMSIDEVQAIVSAPWSYTITKSISLKDEHPFKIDEPLLEELVESAKKQSKLVFATNKMAATLGLELTHGDVIGISVNDYIVENPIGQEARDITLSYLESAIAKDITETLEDMVSKFFPQARLTQYSFMYVFYLTLKYMHPNTSEICLIDVTGEATELGVVRDDILRHTTFTPMGTYTLARTIATTSNTTKEEAYSYMKDDPSSIAERLPKRSQESVQAEIDAYVEELSSMFKRTGDTLSVPKTIFMHTDARTETFFKELLERATAAATGKPHTIHPVTSKVLGLTVLADTALVVAANFYTKKHHYMKILPKDF